MKIFVGIVLYNPNIDKLLSSINELKNVVDCILLVDNNSDNLVDVKKSVDNLNNVILIENSVNLGIAKALNQILDYSYKNNCDYLLTLDQDSLLEKNMLTYMTNYIGDNIAIVCPRIIDLNRDKQKKYNRKFEYVNRCITSGSLMNLRVCKKVGFFDEKMFIDYVDFDYCKRIMLSGYKILRVNEACIEHEVGKRTKRKFMFWDVYPTNHNEKRIYYFSRNLSYYLANYRNQMTFREKTHEYIHLLWKFVSVVLYEKDKIIKIRMFFKGIFESKK